MEERYDVNILYYEGHLTYVKQHFLRIFEQTLGLRVCISQRDHLAGRYIADNIIDSAENSNFCVVLVCREIIENGWGGYELNVALDTMVNSRGRQGFRVIPVIVSMCIPDARFRPFYHLSIVDAEKKMYFWNNICRSLGVNYSDFQQIAVPPSVEDFYQNFNVIDNIPAELDDESPPGGPISLPSITASGLQEHATQNTRVTSSGQQNNGTSCQQNIATSGQQTTGNTMVQNTIQQNNGIDAEFISYVLIGILVLFVWKVFNWIFFQLFGF
ncbi:uncharacterized protein LOC144443688 [Glandiceps talaboti]